MPINRRFLTERAIEQQARLIAHLPHPEPLRIPLIAPRGFLARWWFALRFRSSIKYDLHQRRFLFDAPICHLTERHRLELVFVKNAFFDGRVRLPLIGDVQQFLWRLNPWFLRPDGELPNRRQPARGNKKFAGLAERLKARRERRRISRVLRHVDLHAAQKVVLEYLARVDQDAPAHEDDTHPRNSIAPPRSYWDNFVDFWMSHGLSLDEAWDTPRAVLLQRLREQNLQQPGGEQLVIDLSDRFLAPEFEDPR